MNDVARVLWVNSHGWLKQVDHVSTYDEPAVPLYVSELVCSMFASKDINKRSKMQAFLGPAGDAALASIAAEVNADREKYIDPETGEFKDAFFDLVLTYFPENDPKADVYEGIFVYRFCANVHYLEQFDKKPGNKKVTTSFNVTQTEKVPLTWADYMIVSAWQSYKMLAGKTGFNADVKTDLEDYLTYFGFYNYGDYYSSGYDGKAFLDTVDLSPALLLPTANQVAEVTTYFGLDTDKVHTYKDYPERNWGSPFSDMGKNVGPLEMCSMEAPPDGYPIETTMALYDVMKEFAKDPKWDYTPSPIGPSPK